MSDKTKKDRRDDIVALFGVYDVPLKLAPGQIDQAAEFGRNAIFWDYFEQYKHRFRVIGEQFSHGDEWPFGFMGLAKRQYVVDNAIEYDVRLAHVTELPQFIRNERIKGTQFCGVLYLADRKFYFEPITLEDVYIEYWKYPDPFADTAVPDTFTDTMPDALEPLITRAGFERALVMQVDDDTALKLTQAEYSSSIAALQRLWDEKFAEDTKNPLSEDAL